MRISHRIPKANDERIVRRFLWLPLRIGTETRWLETARIHQKFVVDQAVDLAGTPEQQAYWQNVGWWQP